MKHLLIKVRPGNKQAYLVYKRFREDKKTFTLDEVAILIKDAINCFDPNTDVIITEEQEEED